MPRTLKLWTNPQQEEIQKIGVAIIFKFRLLNFGLRKMTWPLWKLLNSHQKRNLRPNLEDPRQFWGELSSEEELLLLGVDE